jgi:hypothetical protein
MPLSRILVLAALLTVACTKSVQTEPVVDPRPGFDRQLAVWNGTGITAYTMEQERVCFCAGGTLARLTVRNGVITDAVYVSTGDLVPAGVRNLYHTIPDLFALMRTAYASTPSRFDVLYHATLGYPAQITVDPSSAIADDNYVINTSNVVKLTTVGR